MSELSQGKQGLSSHRSITCGEAAIRAGKPHLYVMVFGRHSASSWAASNISVKTFSASCHLPDVLHAPIKAE